ncbi:hypothetical protein [Paractinoplanes durhamensis]|uniref:Uncharacterized protein n=1 Tax=Paractinoplanes durhamensis TaxID=113563 RepID=A0ABQ3YVW2_9ACTN|nr:hypothetical protein [Actinoplanes durhamensis]GIE01686.1 hypothetical protein Adu01nite_30360 [Actinoplanes durhamensis]
MVGHRRALQDRRLLVATGVAVVVAVLAGAGLLLGRGSAEEAGPGLQPAAPWEPYVPSPAVSLRPPPAPESNATSLAHSAPATKTSAAPTPAPAALSLSVDNVPATVDLAAEGTRDWLHWGLTTADSVDRKAGGTGELQDTGGTGTRGRYDNNPELFSWTGGTPAGAATRTPTGVYACTAGSTFTLRVPAGQTPRTLHFYAGVWMAEGRLTVSVAGKKATADLANPQAIKTARFTIRFRAPEAGTLQLTWAATKVYHPTCGNIDMQAATLS